jgi:hypothetical protein
MLIWQRSEVVGVTPCKGHLKYPMIDVVCGLADLTRRHARKNRKMSQLLETFASSEPSHVGRRLLS